MTHEKIYRLDKYRIAVYENELVRWETHGALAMERSGNCFLLKDLLVLGNQTREEDGFLIDEFHGHLQKLPPWKDTRYYCFVSELLDNVTGKSLTGDDLKKWSSPPGGGCASVRPHTPGPGTFRLGRYQIRVDADQKCSWKAYGGLQRIAAGQCVIEANILSIGSQEYEEACPAKQVFLDELHALPQWDQTLAWCCGRILRPCQSEEKTGNEGFFHRWKESLRDHPASGTQTAPAKVRPREPLKEKPAGRALSSLLATAKISSLPALVRLKTAWLSICSGKVLMKFLMFFAAVLLIGLAFAFYSIEKGHSWSHWFTKQHHDKHHDHDK